MLLELAQFLAVERPEGIYFCTLKPFFVVHKILKPS
jgi:hypothetical protein